MRRHISLIIIALIVGVSLFTFSSGTAHAYVAGDPQATGCWGNAYVANSGTLQDNNGKTVANIYNWYSRSCATNWVEVTYNASGVWGIAIDIHRQGHHTDSVGSTHQCYPTNCSNYYTGGLSPTWSDMVDGSYIDCIFVALGFQNKYATTTSPVPDAICA